MEIGKKRVRKEGKKKTEAFLVKSWTNKHGVAASTQADISHTGSGWIEEGEDRKSEEKT